MRASYVALLLGMIFAMPAYSSVPQNGDASLYGRVTDFAGTPINAATVVISDAQGRTVEMTNTASDGRYVLHAAPISGRSVWVGKTEKELFTYIPETRPAKSGQLDFQLDAGANIVFVAEGSDGAILDNEAFRHLVQSRVFLTDMSGAEAPGWFGAITTAATNWNWDKGRPAAIVEPGRRYRILVQWEMPGAGKLLFTLDNSGQGYRLPRAGGIIELNIEQEIARSSVAALRAQPNLSAELAESEAHLQTAEAESSNRSQRRREYGLAVEISLAARERETLARAGANIERYRKGDAVLTVLDAEGEPLTGATVQFHQTENDFLFGANPLGDRGAYVGDIAKKMRQSGFNQSYVTARWGLIERTPGEFDWNNIDVFQRGGQHRSDGFSTAGALSLWFTNNPDFIPAYLQHADATALQSAVFTYARAMAARYADHIGIWQINEFNLETSNALHLDWQDRIAVSKAFAAGIRYGNPAAHILNNSLALPYDAPGGHTLQQLIEAGSPADIIGLELYQAGVNRDGFAPVGLDLTAVDHLLDDYSRLGKPLIIDEFSAPSAQSPGSSWWHSQWSDDQQAAYATAIYTIAFSKAQVRGMTWAWGLFDSDAWIEHGGLFDDQKRPKKAFFALKSLLASWRSDGSRTTDSNGRAEWRGFGGDYEVTVARNGKVLLRDKIHVTEQQQQQFVLRITHADAERLKPPPHAS